MTGVPEAFPDLLWFYSMIMIGVAYQGSGESYVCVVILIFRVLGSPPPFSCVIILIFNDQIQIQ